MWYKSLGHSLSIRSIFKKCKKLLLTFYVDVVGEHTYIEEWEIVCVASSTECKNLYGLSQFTPFSE